ncbi:MAG: GntR family transcriptional regulator [Prolixibacteraceae bacterium]|nr:GntR family transcriptional regulator [Prolixibacteraceae bacterium]
MAAIGEINELEIVKEVDFGLYLDGGSHGEILLPKRYVPEECKPGDTIKVFIYLDSEDRLVATTEKPLAMVGDFAGLRVVSNTPVGSFLDWGLMKDLLVPFREQQERMKEGETYLVYVYLDEKSQRIVATSKLDKYLDEATMDYAVNEEVDLIIAKKTDLGYKAIIDNSHWGILYYNEVFQPLNIGDRIKGLIKNIRPDQKIDLYLEKPGFEKIDSLSETILTKLKEKGEPLPYNDKTSPKIIADAFHVSKKTFKKALGTLYKKHLIHIDEKRGISLMTEEEIAENKKKVLSSRKQSQNSRRHAEYKRQLLDKEKLSRNEYVNEEQHSSLDEKPTGYIAKKRFATDIKHSVEKYQKEIEITKKKKPVKRNPRIKK